MRLTVGVIGVCLLLAAMAGQGASASPPAAPVPDATVWPGVAAGPVAPSTPVPPPTTPAAPILFADLAEEDEGRPAGEPEVGAANACVALLAPVCAGPLEAAGGPRLDVVIGADVPLPAGGRLWLRGTGLAAAMVAGSCVERAVFPFFGADPGPVRVVEAPPIPCDLVVTVEGEDGRAVEHPPVELNRIGRSFTLAATGDLLIHTTVTARAREADGDLDFARLLRQAAPVIAAADVGLCHLEVPLTTDRSRLSGYPTFNAPAELAGDIADTGWDVCSVASNHTIDRGYDGVVSTLGLLDRAGIQHAGAARTAAEQRAPTLRQVGGAVVGFLSFTYGTNGIPLPADKPWVVDVIDPPAIADAARRARAAGAEVVVLSLHWGEEYQHTPTRWQRQVAAEVAATGLVDVIIGHHAHVIQPLGEVDGLPVAWGLGNFLSGQFATAARSDGVILQAHVTEPHGYGQGWSVDFGWTPTRVDPAGFEVRVLEHPETATDRASAERTAQHLAG